MRELVQAFRFAGATKEELADVLSTAPLLGDRSIFGSRRVESTSTEDGARRAIGFEPVAIPLLRFDVGIQRHDAGSEIRFIVEFSQPGQRRPYLVGQFVWLLGEDSGPTAVLREEINTATALEIVDTPLHGAPLSFRRWLFFSGGHQRLMKVVAANLRSLMGADPEADR